MHSKWTPYRSLSLKSIKKKRNNRGQQTTEWRLEKKNGAWLSPLTTTCRECTRSHLHRSRRLGAGECWGRARARRQGSNHPAKQAACDTGLAVTLGGGQGVLGPLGGRREFICYSERTENTRTTCHGKIKGHECPCDLCVKL